MSKVGRSKKGGRYTPRSDHLSRMQQFRTDLGRVETTALIWVGTGWVHVPGSALRPGVSGGDSIIDLDDVAPPELMYQVEWDGQDGYSVTAFAGSGSGIVVAFDCHEALHVVCDVCEHCAAALR